MEIHFINVGCGNMVLIITSTKKVVYDCNITDDNEGRVLRYLRRVLASPIDIFVCSHRDADHMRGINTLHAAFPISTIFDSGATGTSPSSGEYEDYMDLRRKIGYTEITANKYHSYGDTKFRWMNSKSSDYTDPNRQSIVLKLEHDGGGSCLLAGDTDFKPWKEKILPSYGEDVKSDIFLAPHHGSISFFDDPSEQYYYEDHIKKINPAMTLISVGSNVHGLPDKKALELYARHCTGSNKENKIYTTMDQGTMKLVLKDDGGWSISTNQ